MDCSISGNYPCNPRLGGVNLLLNSRTIAISDAAILDLAPAVLHMFLIRLVNGAVAFRRVIENWQKFAGIVITIVFTEARLLALCYRKKHGD